MNAPQKGPPIIRAIWIGGPDAGDREQLHGRLLKNKIEIVHTVSQQTDLPKRWPGDVDVVLICARFCSAGLKSAAHDKARTSMIKIQHVENNVSTIVKALDDRGIKPWARLLPTEVESRAAEHVYVPPRAQEGEASTFVGAFPHKPAAFNVPRVTTINEHVGAVLAPKPPDPPRTDVGKPRPFGGFPTITDAARWRVIELLSTGPVLQNEIEEDFRTTFASNERLHNQQKDGRDHFQPFTSAACRRLVKWRWVKAEKVVVGGKQRNRLTLVRPRTREEYMAMSRKKLAEARHYGALKGAEIRRKGRAKIARAEAAEVAGEEFGRPIEVGAMAHPALPEPLIERDAPVWTILYTSIREAGYVPPKGWLNG